MILKMNTLRRDGIKENLIITIKRHEVALKRKELFGVWNH